MEKENSVEDDIFEGIFDDNSILEQFNMFDNIQIFDEIKKSEDEEYVVEQLIPDSLLFQYVKDRNVDATRNFDGEVLIKDEQGKTPLHYALSVEVLNETDYQIIEILLERGARIDAIDEPALDENGLYGRTLCPLLMAAEKNDSHLVSLLLDSQKERTIDFYPAEDIKFDSPLFVAIQNKNMNIFNLLLDAGAEAHVAYGSYEDAEGQYMEYTVHYAAEVDFYEGFVYLFDDFMSYIMSTDHVEGVYSPVSAFLEIYLHTFVSGVNPSKTRNYLKNTTYYTDIINIVKDCLNQQVPFPDMISVVVCTAHEEASPRTRKILDEHKDDELISLVFLSNEITMLYRDAIDDNDIKKIKQNYPGKNPFRSLQPVFTANIGIYKSLIEYAMTTTEKDAPDFWLQLKEVWLAPYLLMIYMPQFFLNDSEPNFDQLKIFAMQDPACLNFQVVSYDYRTETTIIIALLPALFDAFSALTALEDDYDSYEIQHTYETSKKKFLENLLAFILAHPDLCLPIEHVDVFNNTLAFSIQHCLLAHLQTINFNQQFLSYSSSEQTVLLELINRNMELLAITIQSVEQKIPSLFKEDDWQKNNDLMNHFNKTFRDTNKKLINLSFMPDQSDSAKKLKKIRSQLNRLFAILSPSENKDNSNHEKQKKRLWKEQMSNVISFFKIPPTPQVEKKNQNEVTDQGKIELGKRKEPIDGFQEHGDLTQRLPPSIHNLFY